MSEVEETAMRLGLVLAGMLVVAGGGAMGQAGPGGKGPATGSTVAVAAPLPVYDIVSVKPNKGETFMMGTDGSEAVGRRSFTNWSLKLLVYYTYGIAPKLILGMPEWGDTERWDVVMKVSDPDSEVLRRLNREQGPAMIAAVLEDRFKLKVHKETQELPVFELVVGRGGLKMKPSVEVPVAPGQEYDPKKPGGGVNRSVMRSTRGGMEGTFVPMSSVISSLGNLLPRTVVDKTGLTGKYDLTLKFAPEGGPDTEDAPSIFTAVEEQLGLKLVPAKGPVAVLVVDHAERPAAN